MGCCSNRCFSVLLCLIGLGLSGYTLYVQEEMSKNPETYKALCDIDEEISCTKVFNTTYAKGFGLVDKVLPADHWANQSNAVYGLAGYGFLLLLSLLRFLFLARFQLLLVFLINCFSVYLGYLLVFVIETVCILCYSCYAVNFLLLLASWQKVRALKREAEIFVYRPNKAQDKGFSLPTVSQPRNFKKQV